MISPKRISIAIPAYDELENLRIILPRIIRQLELVPEVTAEILVIVRVHAKEEELTEIRNLGGNPIRRNPSDSFGDAIRTGLKSLSREADFLIIMDADGSHSPETLPNLISAIEATRADIVVASRYVEGGSSDNSFALRMMSKLLNFAYGFVLGIKCKDVSTNFKIYRANLVRDITLSCDNYDVVEELLLQVKWKRRRDFRIAEIPDRFNKRITGESKRNLSVFIATYLITLVRLRFRRQR